MYRVIYVRLFYGANGGMLVNSELESIWMEAVVVLSLGFLG
jgi:hypothetical protein